MKLIVLFIIFTISSAFASDDPCSQIRWGFNENIKRQIGNPKANARLVLKTFQDVIEDGKTKFNRPGLGEEVVVEYPFEVRLGQFCKKALDRGISQLWVSCGAHTEINFDPATNGKGRNASDLTEKVIGRCFISNPKTPSPSWDELNDAAIGGSGIPHSFNIYGNRSEDDDYSGIGKKPYRDRDAAINDPEIREQIYKPSLREILNQLADGETPWH